MPPCEMYEVRKMRVSPVQLILFLCCLWELSSATGDDVTLLRRIEDGNLVSECHAFGESADVALQWHDVHYDTEKTITFHDYQTDYSQSVCNPLRQNIFCNFTSNWFVNFDLSLLPPITDVRWENLPILTLSKTETRKMHNVSRNFTFSIKGHHEASVIVTSGQTHFQVILGSRITMIRQCIDGWNWNEASRLCSNTIQRLKNESTLHQKEWRHFSLELRRNELILNRILQSKQVEKILTLSPENVTIDDKVTVSLNSLTEHKDVLLKVLSVMPKTIFRAEDGKRDSEKSRVSYIRGIVPVKEKTLCVSFWYYYLNTGTPAPLKLIVGTSTVIVTQNHENKWRHFSHDFYITSRDDTVTLRIEQDGQQPATLLSDFRRCESGKDNTVKKWHKSSIPGNFTCSLAFKSESGGCSPCKTIICFNGGTCCGEKCYCAPGFRGKYCRDVCRNGYGQNCAGKCPGSTCKGIEMCSLLFTKECGCASGFHGIDCSEGCPPNKYGFNCAENCGNCSLDGSCDLFTGNCTQGCASGYFVWTSECQHDAVYLNTTAIQSVNPTLSRLHLNITFDKQYYIGEGKPESFRIQYREKSASKWKPQKAMKIASDGPLYNITGLYPETAYAVRVILIDKYGINSIINASYVTFYTNCTSVEEPPTNITVGKVKSNSVTLSWEAPISISESPCRISQYEVWWKHKGHEYPPVSTNSTNATIANLSWSTMYRIKVRGVHRNGGTNFTEPVEVTTKVDYFLISIISAVSLAVMVFIVIAIVCLVRRRSSRVSHISKHVEDEHEQCIYSVSTYSQLVARDASKEVENLEFPPAASCRPTLSRPVPIPLVRSYVDEALASGELKKQFKLMPLGQTKTWKYGAIPENNKKNRFRNIIAYDETRVFLSLLEGESCSDYINANYIASHLGPRSYIATQGPLKNTVKDFWRMVWQENVQLIVMLTNVQEDGKVMCEKYWPILGNNMLCENVSVKCSTITPQGGFIFREFILEVGDEERRITQAHFTSWPIKCLPSNPQIVATFVKELLLIRRGQGPTLVHCSGGTGRTGIIIMVDALLKMASSEARVDFLAQYQRCREGRVNMVTTFEQYAFVHKVLACALNEETFVIPCSQLEQHLQTLLEKTYNNTSGELERQFELLNEETKGLHANVPTVTSDNIRVAGVVPGLHGRLFIHPRDEEESPFFNGVYVDSFQTSDCFITTQLPLTHTQSHFWQMIYEHKVKTIVLLQLPDEKQTDQPTFWPTRGTVHIGDFKLRAKEETQTRSIAARELVIRRHYEKSTEKSRVVRLIRLLQWNDSVNCPHPQGLVGVYLNVENLHPIDGGPIVVVCKDGASGCGAYVAASFVFDKVKLNQEVDVYLAVKTVRQRHPHFVPTVEQYEFIYRAAQLYLESFSLYANFQDI